MNRPITVFIVDDSAVVRQVFSDFLKSQPDIRVLGSASNPIIARKMMQKQWPDVILLDIEMPQMNGLEFLRLLSQEHPTAVVICSTLTEKNAPETMEAFRLGAVEVLLKPGRLVDGLDQASGEALLDAVRSAAKSRTRVVQQASQWLQKSMHATEHPSANDRKELQSRYALPPDFEPAWVAVGASTGGPQAIELLLKGVADCPPTFIVQHMPERYTAAFASRLNQHSPLDIAEARDGEEMRRGMVRIAPGNLHLQGEFRTGRLRAKISDGPRVNRHKPAVDVLFHSLARSDARGLAILLTGMGSDGAAGMAELHQRNHLTIAQDRESSVVYGMPFEALKRQAVSMVLPLTSIADLYWRLS
jgi:two-component system chemotaxis response regulator CheB